MQRVISINLNGNAYQVERRGFAALTAYLDRALAQLAGNPDRAEILADLEQAIADKCQRTLNAHKTVVTARRSAADPPGDGAGRRRAGEAGATAAPGAAGDAARTGPALPKRLYKIREGKVISGVCQGLAAYFDVDVALVRVFFVVLNVLSGLGFLLYILLAFILPTRRNARGTRGRLRPSLQRPGTDRPRQAELRGVRVRPGAPAAVAAAAARVETSVARRALEPGLGAARRARRLRRADGHRHGRDGHRRDRRGRSRS